MFGFSFSFHIILETTGNKCIYVTLRDLSLFQLMALLLLRHALTITNGDADDDDASTMFSVSGGSYAFLLFLDFTLYFHLKPSLETL